MLEKEIIDYWTRRAPSYSEINQKELCGRQKDLWTSYIMRRVQEAMPERTEIILAVFPPLSGNRSTLFVYFFHAPAPVVLPDGKYILPRVLNRYRHR